MNDLEREIRDAFRRHEDEAPALDITEARRAAGRARHRQIRNVIVGGIAGAAAVVVAVAGLGELVRADPPPTIIDRPTTPPTCAADPGPDPELYVWPDTSKNLAGVYAWDGGDHGSFVGDGFMHNGYSKRPGEVSIFIQGTPGRLIPHRGQTEVNIAGCEGTYRRFSGNSSTSLPVGRYSTVEEWMTDIRGTTVTITLAADPRTQATELAEAHAVIDSIRSERWDRGAPTTVGSFDGLQRPGFRLVFTLPTDTWDSG